jgi:hypothetical protein
MSVGKVSTTNALFIDPVTYDVMEDPVVCSDGHTYDRSTAERMSTSPFTRVPLTVLADNVDLRGAIFEANPEVCASYAI